MIVENEFWNSYWEDKRAKVGRIECPAYVLASYSSKFHGQGSFRGWREISTKQKWYAYDSNKVGILTKDATGYGFITSKNGGIGHSIRTTWHLSLTIT